MVQVPALCAWMDALRAGLTFCSPGTRQTFCNAHPDRHCMRPVHVLCAQTDDRCTRTDALCMRLEYAVNLDRRSVYPGQALCAPGTPGQTEEGMFASLDPDASMNCCCTTSTIRINIELHQDHSKIPEPDASIKLLLHCTANKRTVDQHTAAGRQLCAS